ncbi:N-acetylmuramoyl-L-alanine amidase [Amedibacterium intestinale]|jgi:hypothetical protein|uniref:N-acetylmuramoyl-L-alanine amidase n=1 Tax=Amedibacterium intestinale TaxID=2583452 RepID=UPI000E49F9A7|nr:N-acetylmuramoyl-L-alanine amidase [Amedibacterium intestinale]RHO23771.1 N-acetylmuramoyl-L-alanine amidase [Eubacterium sp. AM18-26]RHO27865.1 N-acetylmuramoyl-L-alanine amidase [Eubacterium sp. AM18-10LB-B]DAU93621.1 MAG TPA: Cell wall hydrolase autolysin [Caudoviricetes sp.]
MKINVHGGHNAHTPGASSILNELKEDRIVKDEVIRLLKAEGHTVYDCTDDAGKNEDQNLINIVKNCNSHTVDLDVSIHLNSGRNDLSGDNSTGGVEVFIYDKSSNSPVEEAERVCAAISKKLGLRNRGVKVCGNNLYVVAKTKAPAMLVECCFVDDKDDADRWNAKKCAEAIVEGILNKEINSQPVEKPSEKPSTPKPQPKPKKIDVDHQAYANGKWWGNIRNYNNKNTNGYSGVIGVPLLGLQANTVGKASEVGYLEYRLHRKGGSWFNWQRDRDKDKYGEYFAGDLKTQVDGLQMRLVNAPKGKKVRYRVHCIGKGWLGWITNYGSGNNGYAGWYGYAIDAVQIEVI